MPIRVAVPKEIATGERRVALTPEVAQKFRQAGVQVALQRGAGESSFFHDADYDQVELVDSGAELYAGADVVLKVQPPTEEEIGQLREGAVVVGFMQPHRYTRLHSLFDDFSNCFNDADAVIITPVYSAGEQPIDGARHTDLVSGLKTRGHRQVQAVEGPEELPALVRGMAEPGDFVVFLGAGNITQWAYALPGQLDDLRKERA